MLMGANAQNDMSSSLATIHFDSADPMIRNNARVTLQSLEIFFEDAAEFNTVCCVWNVPGSDFHCAVKLFDHAENYPIALFVIGVAKLRKILET